MQGLSDIKIIGIDQKRPPRVRKEPYIDLFFKLSHKAPEAWCEDFNKLGKKLDPPVKIDKTQGLFIDAYVRDMSYIPAHLDKIKNNIIACNEQYMERVRQRELAAAARNAPLSEHQGAQSKLDTIIAALKFDD